MRPSRYAVFTFRMEREKKPNSMIIKAKKQAVRK
jgi:hypothetical protein